MSIDPDGYFKMKMNMM